MALGSGLIGMGNAPGKRRKEEDEILAMGMGPRRAMPEEKEYIKPSTFKDADIPIVSSQPDKAASMHTKNRIERGEQGLREREFSYNVYDDPLYQQYISSARRNGQNAMTDTMAKVASQTGGIAGSYAVAAGAGAYNDYMQRANDVIPELEQIAYQKYQDDLARDREIYKMDEAKRLEDAQYNATLSTHQNYGRPHTDEEKMLIYANGGYITPDGDVIDANGNLIKRGTKYDEEVAEAKAETESKTLKEASDKANNAIVNYMLGNDLKSEDVLMLLDLGYNYANGILYDPFGNAVEQSYKKADLASEDELKTAINALRYKKTLSDSHIQALTTAGFGYNGKGWFNANGVNALDFFDTPEGTVSSEPAKPPEDENDDDTTGGGKKPSEIIEEGKKEKYESTNKVEGTVQTYLLVGDIDGAKKYLDGLLENKAITKSQYEDIVYKHYNEFVI